MIFPVQISNSNYFRGMVLSLMNMNVRKNHEISPKSEFFSKINDWGIIYDEPYNQYLTNFNIPNFKVDDLLNSRHIRKLPPYLSSNM